MEPRTPSGSGITALGVAALLHVALLALGPLLSTHFPTAPPGAAVVADTFDLDLTPPPSPAPPPAAEPSAPAGEDDADDEEPPSQGQANAKEVAPSPIDKMPSIVGEKEPSAQATKEPAQPPASNDARGDAPSPTPTPTPGPASGPPNSEYGPPSSGPVVGVPGVDGRPIWALPGVLAPPSARTAAPTVATGPKPVDSDVASQVLSGGLAKKDKSVGLDLPAAGAVASAVATAVRSVAPSDAKATFEVKLDAAGKVLGVRVLKSNGGDGAAWERAAKGAASALSAKALAMTGEAASRGATVTVKIESKQVLPAGSKEKIDVQPVCAEEVLQAMANALADPAAAAAGHGPVRDPATNRIAFGEPDENGRRKFCIPVGIAGKGDVSNLGAHAQTVVTSSFSVQVPHTLNTEDVKEVDQRAPWSPADPNKVKLPRPWGKPKKKKK